ncbi:MAG: glutamate--tRNA ligase [Thiotrichales bacterium]
MTVRTRFAPSPTGYLHIGGARTALFSWLYARRHGGTFILRIEDTDRERSTEASVQAIFDGMRWLGLDHDEGPFFQTRRMDRYTEILQRLLEQGDAYHCYCSKEALEHMRADQVERKEKPRYDGRCRHRTAPPPEGVAPVIRFRNPLDGEVVIDDMVKGRVVIRNDELDDLIIARGDGTPTYNFTVVVDDFDMGITHVIRGDDHLNNTPRQINILNALGATLPRYAHVPMILGEDGARLSKRHGAVSVMQYAEDGYLPEALLNYLVRLGWSHGDQELFTREEMIQLFDLDGVNKAASMFNPKKLLWINEQYLKAHDPVSGGALLAERLSTQGIDTAQGPDPVAVYTALKERAKTLLAMAESAHYFYADPERYDATAAAKQFIPATAAMFERLRTALEACDDWTAVTLHHLIAEFAQAQGLKMGQVGMPLRVALSGAGDTPDIGVTLGLIGKDATLRRIDRAVRFIQSR